MSKNGNSLGGIGMKKCFLGLIVIMVTVSMLVSFVGCTKETPAECFDYEIEGNHIIITGLVKTDLEKIVIPERIEGSFVTAIAEDAFRECTNLISVTIPDSVTKIDEDAFEDCTGLVEVIIPDSVKEIGESAFSGCTSLTSVIIPNGVTEISYRTFADCTSLTNVTIPVSVTEIGWSAFAGCTSLGNITIPDSVKHIASDAFEGTGVKLP